MITRRSLLAALPLAPFATALLPTPAAAAQGAGARARALRLLEEADRRRGQDDAGARKCVEGALSLCPFDGDVLTPAVAVASKFDLELAYRCQRQFVAACPDAPQRLTLLAWLAYQNQDFDGARQAIAAWSRGPAAGNVQHIRDTWELLRERRFRLTWTFYPDDRALGPDGWALVGIPTRSLPRQSSSVAVSGAVEAVPLSEERGDLLRVRWREPQPFQVVATVTVRVHSDRALLRRYAPGPVPEAVRKYLGQTYYVDPANPPVAALARGLRGASPAETLPKILGWFREHFRYERDWGIGSFRTVDEVLARGAGNCGAYSALFVTLCRACGLPARELWAKLPTRGRKADDCEGHSLGEVYVTGGGWLPVEPHRGPELIGFLPTEYVLMPRFDDATGQTLGGTEGVLRTKLSSEDLTDQGDAPP